MGAERIVRVGPDKPLTHWLLWSKPTMRWLCKRKFGKFGAGSEFRPGAYAVHTEHIYIGSGVVIRPNSMLFADDTWSIYVGDRALLGPGIHMYVNNHVFANPGEWIDEQGYVGGNIWIGCGAWIGANVTILPNVQIGPGAVIGAGSVVTRSVPAFEVWAGNPARMIRKVDG